MSCNKTSSFKCVVMTTAVCTERRHTCLTGQEIKEVLVSFYNHLSCALVFSSPPLLPALCPRSSSSFILLFLHVFASHSLTALRQPPTSGAIFTCLEAAAVVTRMTLWGQENKGQWCNSFGVITTDEDKAVYNQLHPCLKINKDTVFTHTHTQSVEKPV